MPRKATSPEEIEQIARVHGLLSNVGVAPSPKLMVTLASGKKFSGQLVKECVSSMPDRRGRSRVYSGVLTLETEDGSLQIDYLDIVWLQKAEPAAGRGKGSRVPRQDPQGERSRSTARQVR
jgi:hypothetical protein